jgi:hypothetical protein
MLSCFGSRCWISTKAMPQFAGRAANNFLNVSRPPAEAPRATTGKIEYPCASRAHSPAAGSGRPVEAFVLSFVVAFVSPASMRETCATQLILSRALHGHDSSSISGFGVRAPGSVPCESWQRHASRVLIKVSMRSAPGIHAQNHGRPGSIC